MSGTTTSNELTIVSTGIVSLECVHAHSHEKQGKEEKKLEEARQWQLHWR